jgi:hypothetical protein
LDRAERAGDQYHLEATSTNKTTTNITVSGQLMRSTEDWFSVSLSADVTIVEANSTNWATRKRVKVLSSKWTRTGNTGPLLPEGAILDARIAGGRTLYEVDNKPVDEEVGRMLAAVINLHVSSQGDDDMFGTTSPKAVGESWTVNADSTKSLLKEMKSQGGRQEIHGTGSLERIEGNHLFVRSSITVYDVLLPTAGVVPEGGEVGIDYWGRIPLQQSDPTRDVSGRIYMNLNGSATSNDGKKLKIQIIFESASHWEMRAINSKAAD